MCVCVFCFGSGFLLCVVLGVVVLFDLLMEFLGARFVIGF